MTKIGLFYGTQTGNTETVAEMIQNELGKDVVELHDISSVDLEQMKDYTYLIIGCPTWNIGELQSDWQGVFDDLDDVDFSGKKVAYFGVGDQFGYPDNFQDAMGILEEKITENGGITIGFWPIDGYEFTTSKATRDGQFIGLALDEDNQPELTKQRVKSWVAQLKSEMNI